MPLCTTKVPKMCEYVRIVEEEADDEPIELPSEEDGTMLLSTLTAQFPGASGLKYRNPDTGTLRGLRVFDGRIQAPDGHWGETLYIAVFPKGEKGKLKLICSHSINYDHVSDTRSTVQCMMQSLAVE